MILYAFILSENLNNTYGDFQRVQSRRLRYCFHLLTVKPVRVIGVLLLLTEEFPLREIHVYFFFLLAATLKEAGKLLESKVYDTLQLQVKIKTKKVTYWLHLRTPFIVLVYKHVNVPT